MKDLTLLALIELQLRKDAIARTECKPFVVKS